MSQYGVVTRKASSLSPGDRCVRREDLNRDLPELVVLDSGSTDSAGRDVNVTRGMNQNSFRIPLEEMVFVRM